MSGTYIGTIKGTDGVVYPIGSTLFGTCNTGANVAIKEVFISNSGKDGWKENETPSFNTLQKGLTIHVFMQHSNTSTGEVALKINGSNTSHRIKNGERYVGNTPATSWSDNTLITFTYNGSEWVINTLYSDLWYILCEMTHSNETRAIKLPGEEIIDNHKIIDADVISNALGYTPAASASVAGHAIEKISGDNADKRHRLIIS